MKTAENVAEVMLAGAVAVLVEEAIRIAIHLPCWMTRTMLRVLETLEVGEIVDQVNPIVAGVDLAILRAVTIVTPPHLRRQHLPPVHCIDQRPEEQNLNDLGDVPLLI